MLGFFRIVPIIVFALGGGVVADALDRRRLMLFTQTALAMVSVALAVLAHAQRTTPAAIYALAFVAGAATAFDNPARQALVPRLVDREQLPNALSLYATVWQVATIAGPALGGALLAWSGPTAIYLLDVLSFGAVIAALLAMKHRHVGLGKSQISAKAALDGLRFIRRTPLIWSTMLLDFAATFFAGSMLLLPIFADQLLHVGPRGLGFLYAAQPAGAALTGAALSTFPLPRRQGAAMLWAVALYGAANRGVRHLALVLAQLPHARLLGRGGHREHGDPADHPPDAHARRAARPDELGQHDLLHGRAAAGRGGSRRGGEVARRPRRGRVRRPALRGHGGGGRAAGAGIAPLRRLIGSSREEGPARPSFPLAVRGRPAPLDCRHQRARALSLRRNRRQRELWHALPVNGGIP